MGTTGSTQSKVRGVAEKKATTRGWRAALVEMFIILALYVAYSGSRLFASDSLRPAQRRAADLLDLESALHLSWEGALNQVFAVSRGLSLFGSFWYATAHYVVTAVVLVWLYRRGRDVVRPGPPGPGRRHDHRAGRLPVAADRPAPALRRVRRRAGADVR